MIAHIAVNMWFMIYLLLLCVVQGVGECLPISSSAHLFLFSTWANYTNVSFDVEVALHLGSLMALCVYLRKQLLHMIFGTFKSIVTRQLNDGAGAAIILVIATIPCIVIGFALKRIISIEQTVVGIGIVSLIFGSVLLFADKIGSEKNTKVSFTSALIMGCVQVLAFLPGASRLGSCLIAGRFLNIQRAQVTQFSFLLAIPVILGAVVLTGIDAVKAGAFASLLSWWPEIFVTGAISYAVLVALSWYIDKGYSYVPFAIYRILLGISILIFMYI